MQYHHPGRGPSEGQGGLPSTSLRAQQGPRDRGHRGNIIAMSGMGEITIGDTICAPRLRGAH